MDGVGNNGGSMFHEFKRDIPLDDLGIAEERALTTIQAAVGEALSHPAKVRAVVFGILMEDDAMILTPDGNPANNLLILAGSGQCQVALLRIARSLMRRWRKCERMNRRRRYR